MARALALLAALLIASPVGAQTWTSVGQSISRAAAVDSVSSWATTAKAYGPGLDVSGCALEVTFDGGPSDAARLALFACDTATSSRETCSGIQTPTAASFPANPVTVPKPFLVPEIQLAPAPAETATVTVSCTVTGLVADPAPPGVTVVERTSSVTAGWQEALDAHCDSSTTSYCILQADCETLPYVIDVSDSESLAGSIILDGLNGVTIRGCGKYNQVFDVRTNIVDADTSADTETLFAIWSLRGSRSISFEEFEHKYHNDCTRCADGGGCTEECQPNGKYVNIFHIEDSTEIRFASNHFHSPGTFTGGNNPGRTNTIWIEGTSEQIEIIDNDLHSNGISIAIQNGDNVNVEDNWFHGVFTATADGDRNGIYGSNAWSNHPLGFIYKATGEGVLIEGNRFDMDFSASTSGNALPHFGIVLGNTFDLSEVVSRGVHIIGNSWYDVCEAGPFAAIYPVAYNSMRAVGNFMRVKEGCATKVDEGAFVYFQDLGLVAAGCSGCNVHNVVENNYVSGFEWDSGLHATGCMMKFESGALVQGNGNNADNAIRWNTWDGIDATTTNPSLLTCNSGAFDQAGEQDYSVPGTANDSNLNLDGL